MNVRKFISLKKSSLIWRLSLTYLTLTLINVLIFWVITGANQIRLITEKSLFQSQAIAHEIKAKFKDIQYTEPLNPQLIKFNTLLKKGTKEVPIEKYSLLKPNGKVLYQFPSSQKDNEKSKLVISLYKAFQLREENGQAFTIEPDILNHNITLIIPLTTVSQKEIAFYSVFKLTSIKDELNSLYRLAIGMVILLLLIQSIFALVLYSTLIKPLVRLAKGAEEVKSGNLDVKIDLPKFQKDEIYYVINTFNSMVNSLKNKTNELTKTIQHLNDKDKLIQKELELAQSIQIGIMPKVEIENSRLKATIDYFPLTKVSGDYYDIFNLPKGNFAILMCDASGHGVPAALITVMAKLYFTLFSSTFSKLDVLFQKLNEELTKSIITTDYLTAFYIVVKKDLKFEFINASHQNSFIIRKRTKRIEELDSEGFMLGAMDELPFPYQVGRGKLNKGDKLVLYTDGLTEASNKKNIIFGKNRLIKLLENNANKSIDEIKKNITRSVNRYTKDSQKFDDYSLMVIEFK